MKVIVIVLFTDYGLSGPYLGQVESVLYQHAPEQKVVNLIADAPRQNPRVCAYLLASLVQNFPQDTVFFSVVDPGVGSFRDDPVILKLDDCWYIGPNNGLFDIVARRSDHVECWKIHWRPEQLSASFHGRDLYAPLCAMVSNGLDIPGEVVTWEDRHQWPDDLQEIIYIDHFGNCVSGVRAASLDTTKVIISADNTIPHAMTFSEVGVGQALWYENSMGLVEIAVNRGNAAEQLELAINSPFQFQ